MGGASYAHVASTTLVYIGLVVLATAQVPSPSQLQLHRLSINCGSQNGFTDRFGRNWIPDSYYNHGREISSATAQVQSALGLPELHATRREGASFDYVIPLSAFNLTRPSTCPLSPELQVDVRFIFSEVSAGVLA